MHGALMSYFCLRVMVSRIQGKAYELLYSPEAVFHSSSIREALARRLAAELQQVTDRTQKTYLRYSDSETETVDQNTMEVINVSDEALRLSLLAIIYRAVPSPPGSTAVFGTECIDATGVTLKRQQDYMAVMARDSYCLFPMYMS
ncbi:hypothetical protein LZ30DRAFT_814301 [Colletotrichum cereale]|nr:hypothetical protein LZ30DRAFT_814301 [Colletotrichum cereale]